MNSARPLVKTVGLIPSGQVASAQDVLRFATCPMCHTPASLTQSALEAGGEWRCVRCGQHWDATRLAAVAAYAAWVVARDAVGANGSKRVSLSHNLLTEQLTGKT
jgi:hypothetical protein